MQSSKKSKTASKALSSAELVLANRILARRRLIQFVKMMHGSYEAGWVHEDICARLERFSAAVVARQSPRLMLLVPPRHGKSEIASIRFPGWHLGQHPDHEIINVGYNLDLPMVFSRKVREMVRDQAYQNIFPGMELDPDAQSIERWNTTKGGGLTAAGVGGGITGKGAHILIIDDPIKNQEEADSPEVRKKLLEWYQSTAYTRLAPGGGVLLIETWWNDDDLAGKLQNFARTDPEADQFEVIKYPALSESYEYRRRSTFAIERSKTPIDDPDLELLRPPDTCLHEARYPTTALKKIKASGMDARIWSALYQQNPIPDEGIFFKKTDFRYYITPPRLFDMNVYTGWDLAIGEKRKNDWTVGFSIAQDENNVWYVVDVTRFKGGTLEIVDAIIEVGQRLSAQCNGRYTLGIEDGQIARAMEPTLKLHMDEAKYWPAYELLPAITDKQSRAKTLQGHMQHGRVYWPDPRTQPWAQQAISELLRFPGGAHDDVVDAGAWAARLTIAAPPPEEETPPPVKSWKDGIDRLLMTDGTHMTA